MATITSAQSGVWSTPSTWVGGVVPGPGDVAVVATGHAVTFTTNTTIGLGGAAADAVRIMGTGNLVGTQGCVLTVRGNYVIEGDPGEGNPRTNLQGAGIEFDVPAGQTYSLYTGTNYNVFASITTRKVGGIRPFIRLKAGSAGSLNLYSPDPNFLFCRAAFDAQDCDFSGFSTWKADLRENYGSGLGVSLTRCTFTNCGFADILQRFGGFHLVDTKFINTVGDSALRLGVDNGAAVAGLVEITRCEFDGNVEVYGNVSQLPITDSVIHRIFQASGTGTAFLQFSGCLFHQTGSRAVPGTYNEIAGTVDGAYHLADYSDVPGLGNDHFYTSSGSARSLTIRGGIFDYVGEEGTDAGDINDVGSSDVTLDGCLVLKSTSTGTPLAAGQTWKFSTGAGTLRVWRSTLYCSDHAAISAGHSANAGAAGEIPEVRDSLIWSDQSGAIALTNDQPYGGGAALATDFATPGGIHHNAFWGLATFASNLVAGATASLIGIARMAFSVVPSAPLVQDPKFLDGTRNFIRWSKEVRGYTGSNAAAIAGGLADISADPTLTRTSLQPWVAAGYAPTNAAYSGAASDGGTIGAVAYQVGAAIVAPPGLSIPITSGVPTVAAGPASVVPPGLATAITPGPPSVTAGPVAVAPPGGAISVTPGSPSIGTGQIAIAPPGLILAISPGPLAVAAGPVVVMVPGSAIGLSLGSPGVGGSTTPATSVVFEVELQAWLEDKLDQVVDLGLIGEGTEVDDQGAAVVLTMVDDTSLMLLSGSAGGTYWRVQLDCWSTAPAAAGRMVERIRQTLQNFRGPMGRATVKSAILLSRPGGFDPRGQGRDDGTSRRTIEFRMCVRESIPTPS